MSQIKVTEHKVHLDRDLRPENGETEANGFVQGPVPEILKDDAIEKFTHREHFQDGEGDISILLEAGDELGQIRIGLQFEGPVGRHQQCLGEQGKLLREGSVWLREILSQFETDWEMSIASAPCKEGDTSVLRLNEMAARLENRLSPRSENVHEAQVVVDVVNDI
jgi:hypothetical protein